MMGLKETVKTMVADLLGKPADLTALRDALNALPPAPPREVMQLEQRQPIVAEVKRRETDLIRSRGEDEKRLATIAAQRVTLEKEEAAILERMSVALSAFSEFRDRNHEVLRAGAPLVLDEFRAAVATLRKDMVHARAEVDLTWPGSDVAWPATNEHACRLRYDAIENLAARVEQWALSAETEDAMRAAFVAGVAALPRIPDAGHMTAAGNSYLRSHAVHGLPLSWRDGRTADPDIVFAPLPPAA